MLWSAVPEMKKNSFTVFILTWLESVASTWTSQLGDWLSGTTVQLPRAVSILYARPGKRVGKHSIYRKIHSRTNEKLMNLMSVYTCILPSLKAQKPMHTWIRHPCKSIWPDLVNRWGPSQTCPTKLPQSRIWTWSKLWRSQLDPYNPSF